MEQTTTAKRWLYLVVGLILIGLFIYVVAPIVQHQSDTFDQLSAFIDHYDIETGAYVYSDLELTAQAGIGARSTMEHPPVGPR